MYVAIDEESRIVAAFSDPGDGLIWCEDITTPNVLTPQGVPKYRYLDGRALMRTMAERQQDAPMQLPADLPELPDIPGSLPSDADRIKALEEELKAAKILLGLEA